MLIDFRNDRGSDLRGMPSRRMLRPIRIGLASAEMTRSEYPRAGMACPIVNFLTRVPYPLRLNSAYATRRLRNLRRT